MSHDSFSYTVDGDAQETAAHQLTPRQILEAAGLNPAERYLVEIRGKQQESYRDRLDELIHMHQKQRFVSVFVGPVPVACR